MIQKKSKPASKPTVLPFAESAGFTDGQVVPAIEGKLTAIYDPKHQEGKFGPYIIQNGKLETEHGEIKFALFAKPESEISKDMKGESIILQSTKGKKGGLVGVMYQVNSYKNKAGETVTEEQLKIDDNASVTIVDDNSDEGADTETRSEPTPAPQARTQPRPQQSRPVHKDAPSFSDALETVIGFHREIDTVVRHVYRDVHSDEETLRSYVSSIFIEANRKGLMDLYVLQSNTDDRTADDAGDDDDKPDWASAVVPSGDYKGQQLVKVPKDKIVEFYNKIMSANKGKPPTTDFQKSVVQAVTDLNLIGDTDDIPF